MRALLLTVLLTATASAQTLQARLDAIAKPYHGQVALYAENLTTHASIGLAPDTPVQTASVIKLTILLEALEQIRANQVHFEDPIQITKPDLVPGSGILTLLDPGKTITFKDASPS